MATKTLWVIATFSPAPGKEEQLWIEMQKVMTELKSNMEGCLFCQALKGGGSYKIVEEWASHESAQEMHKNEVLVGFQTACQKEGLLTGPPGIDMNEGIGGFGRK